MRTIFERFEPVWPDKIKVPPASKMRVTRQHQPIVSNISNDVVNITLVENLGFLWLQNYNLWIAIGNRFQLIDVNTSFSWTICIINSFSVVLMTLFDDNAIIVMAQWSETVDQCLKIFISRAVESSVRIRPESLLTKLYSHLKWLFFRRVPIFWNRIP